MPGQTYVDTRTFEETIRKIKGDLTALKQGISPGTPIPSGEPVIAPGIVAQYWRGDKTWQTLNQAAVAGLTIADSPAWISVKIADANASHHLGFVWNEDLTADQTLNLVTGAADRTITLQGNPTLADWFDQSVKVAARPTHQELFLGPETLVAPSRLIYNSYFDFPTNADPREAGRITGEGTGTGAGGTSDVPGTRGTEWNLDTHQLVAATTQDPYPNGCLIGNVLLTDNTTTGTIQAYDKTTGALLGATAAHGFSQMRGICSDGTHFYIVGIIAAGNVRGIKKYKLSDYSYVATWASVWPEFQSPWGVKISGGFLYSWCGSVDKFFKVNAATMATDSSFVAPVYSPGNYYNIYDYTIDSTGTYMYVSAMNATVNLMLKLNLSDFTTATTGPTLNSMQNAFLCYYSEGPEARIYLADVAGGNYGGKVNPATLDNYYAVTAIAHAPWGIAADEDYLYVWYEDQGIDRLLKNDIGGTPSTEAGVLRFWVNKLGVITEGASLDDDLNFTAKGAFISSIATGTAPVQPTSTTVCPNLNADLLDGNHSAAFETAIAAGTTAQYWRGDKSWQALNQAAVAGLTTADSPTWVNPKASGSITDPTHLATKEYVDLAVASIELTEFFASTASDIGGIYYVMDTPAAGAGTVAAVVDTTANDVALFNFATLAAHPHLDRLVAGTYDCHAHLKATGDGARTVTCYFKLYQRTSPGGVETLLGTSETTVALTGADVAYNSHLNLAAEVTLALTDRLVIKWYGNFGAGNATTVTMTVGGVADPHFSVRVTGQELAAIFVPYTGAEHDVDLGAKTLTAATVKLSDLTNGYIPYHVSDAAGLANSPIFISGTNVGIGTVPAFVFHIKDTTAQFCAQRDSDNNAGPLFRLMKTRTTGTSAQDGDITGYLTFDFYNDAAVPELINSAYLRGLVTDVSDGSEDGSLEFHVTVAGVDRATVILSDVNAWFYGDVSALTFTDRP